jgi:hypothetical protein
MNAETRFEKIDESKLFLYYACTDGYILRVLKSTYAEEKVKPYYRRGKAYGKVNQKDTPIKHLIAKAFIKKYKKGDIVENIDGNPMNCRLDNLRIITKQEFGKKTGGKGNNIPIVITFPDGQEREYPSIRSAAKDLFVSYQTVIDILNAKYKKTVLDGYKIRKKA